MKYFFYIIPFILSVLSCTDFIAQPDMDENCQLRENGPIKLYTKPAGASDTPSPDQQQINGILEN